MKLRLRLPKHVFFALLVALVFMLLTVSIVLPRLLNYHDVAGNGTLFNGSAVGDSVESQNRLVAKGDVAGGSGFNGRREIYDRNFKEIAVNVKRASVYVKPLEFQNADVNGRSLAALMDIKADDLSTTLQSRRNIVCLGKKYPPHLASRIKELKLQGVYTQEEDERYYPFYQTAAHVVGFTREGKGLDGIEFQYDALMRHQAVADQPAEPGGSADGNLVLTLDLRMQALLEKRLEALRVQAEAESASAVIMDPATGAILALANTPGFDPNRFWEYGMLERRNRAIFNPVYPGALNNLFNLAAGIEAGEVKVNLPATPAVEKIKKEKTAKANVRKKEMKVALHKTNELVLHPDWSVAGKKSYVSSQRGFDIKPLADSERLARFAARLGFHEKSNLDLPISGFEEGSKVAPQPINFTLAKPKAETTALHLVTALAALVNGGHTVTPHLLAEMWEPQSGTIKPMEIKPGQTILSQETSQALLTLLASSERKGPADSYFLESLVPLESPPPAEEIKKSSGEEKRLPEKEKKVSDNSKTPNAGGESVAVEEEKEEETKYQAVMMGLVPVNAPTMIMLVVLDRARVDLGGPSPMRLMGYDFLPKVVTWAGVRESQPTAEQIAERQEELAASWRQFEARVESKPYTVLDEQEAKMPDLKGCSLRRALQILQAYELDVKVQGAGRVVKQFPEAGRTLKGKNCLLELRIDS